MGIQSKTPGYCPICGKYKQLVVDHDHDTDLIRGRVCVGCNVHIMYAVDHIDLVAAGIVYKERPPGCPDLPKTFKQYISLVVQEANHSKMHKLTGRTFGNGQSVDWADPIFRVGLDSVSYDDFMDGHEHNPLYSSER
jgi:hypothetical protein